MASPIHSEERFDAEVCATLAANGRLHRAERPFRDHLREDD